MKVVFLLVILSCVSSNVLSNGLRSNDLRYSEYRDDKTIPLDFVQFDTIELWQTPMQKIFDEWGRNHLYFQPSKIPNNPPPPKSYCYIQINNQGVHVWTIFTTSIFTDFKYPRSILITLDADKVRHQKCVQSKTNQTLNSKSGFYLNMPLETARKMLLAANFKLLNDQSHTETKTIQFQFSKTIKLSAPITIGRKLHDDSFFSYIYSNTDVLLSIDIDFKKELLQTFEVDLYLESW